MSFSTMLMFSVLALLPTISAYAFLWYLAKGLPEENVRLILDVHLAAGTAGPVVLGMALPISATWSPRRIATILIMTLACIVNGFAIGLLMHLM